MKKILNSILITIIFVIPFVTNINIVDAKILKYGDINEDGFIDGEDVSLVHAFINNAEIPTAIQKALSDINHDGNIDNTDKDLIYQMTINTSEIYQKGDVNMNGIIDPLDRSLVSHRIGSKINLNTLQEKLADANGDGVISALDTSYILRNTNKNLLTYKLNLSTNDGSDPNFSSDSTDKGLFVQVSNKTKTENGFPVYYYRGAVENNYVQFGTYRTDITNNVYNTETDSFEIKVVAHTNDPILWRIVSINTDGSIKLVSQYNINDCVSPWGWSGNNIPSSKYITDDGKNNLIKDQIENWYYNSTSLNDFNSVCKEYDNKILKTDYCNDISDNYQSVKNRLKNTTPSFICPEDAIKANEKIGLLTSDEIMYTGGLLNNENPVKITNPTFLYNNTQFWTISPASNENVYLVGKDGYMTSEITTSCKGARPVIILKPDVEVTGNGDGSKNNPYVINTSKGNTTTIIMNTTNESEENIITEDILNKTKENGKVVIYETYNTNSENGKFKYSWSIRPNDITDAKDINTTITIKDSVSASDGEVYNRMKYALKNNDVRYVTLEEQGKDTLLDALNFVSIDVDVSDKYTDGTRIYVYRWDNLVRRYKETSYSTLVSDGRVTFYLNPPVIGSYIISANDLSSIIENPPTGMIMFIVIGLIGLLLMGGITYLIYSKKNNRFLKV